MQSLFIKVCRVLLEVRDWAGNLHSLFGKE